MSKGCIVWINIKVNLTILYWFCVLNNMMKISFTIFYSDFLIKLRNTTGIDEKVNCGCYPPCDDVNYIVEGDNTIQW